MKRLALFLIVAFYAAASQGAWPPANSQIITGGYYTTVSGKFPICTGDATGVDCVNRTASFYAPLISSLTPAWSVGSGTPTFTRATTATVFGYAENAVSGASQQLLTIPAGIPRFSGARFKASTNTWDIALSDGTPIPSDQLLGYLSEGAATNFFLNSGAPATQTITLGTGTYTTWLTGTGSIAISAGTATITGAGTATAGSPVTFTVTVAGTVVCTVAGTPTTAQVENTAFPTSYIATTGASVIRNADVLKYPTSGNVIGTSGSSYSEISEEWTNAQNSLAFRIIDIGVTRPALYMKSSHVISIFDGTTQSAGVSFTASGAIQQAASAWGGAVMVTALNGIASINTAFDGDMNVGTTMSIGCDNTSAAQWYGNIRNVRIWQTQLPNSTLQAITR